MLNIDDELKELYKQENVYKNIRLYFPALDLTIENDRIPSEKFELTESLCSYTDLTLGCCESAQIRVTVADILQDISGFEMQVIQEVDNAYEMPLGTYWIMSAEKQADKRFKEIIALDAISKTNVDVSDWYNALLWPQTVKSMRESLLTYLGIEFENQTLSNDGVSLQKTITPTSLIGRDVLIRLCEINAGFGHITRQNKFKVIQLSGLGLYPSETLYPSEDLFPSESGEYITSGYIKADYEEYIVEQLTGVSIREDDEDTGVSSGTTGNVYTITGNFLLYGMSGATLQPIAYEIYLQVKNKYYRPHVTTMVGLPYIEVGDSVTVITTNDAIESFVFSRVMTGVQDLRDEISATGNRYRSQTVSPNTEIQQLKSKTLKIQKSVDGVSIDLSNLETETNARFELQDDEIALKVSKGTVSSEISVEPDVITLNSNRLIVNSTKFQLDALGNVTVSGDIVSANMTGGSINGSEFTQSNGTVGRTEIKNGMLTGMQIMLRPVVSGGGSFAGNSSGYFQMSSATLNFYNGSTITFSVTQGGALTCSELTNTSEYMYFRGQTLRAPIGSTNTITINGFPFINTYNKDSYTFPPESHTHSSLYTGSYQVFLGSGGGFASANGGDLGSPTFRWGTVYAQTGTINTSDRTLKNSIEDLPEIYEQLILRCRPVRFKYNEGTSDRYHTGFISQEVEELMIELGIDSKDFGGFVKAPVYEIMNEDGEFDTSSPITGYIYMLRYEEFISPAFQVIKKQQDQLKSQEERMHSIEERLKALEEGVKNG